MKVHIFDIETKPDPEKVKAFTKPFKKEEVKVGNLKDPEKIAAKLEQAEADYWQKANDQAALNPHTSEIIAIGVHLEGEEPQILAGSEDGILHQFWSLFNDRTHHRWAYWTGSNDKSAFDIRHIIVRSWVNRVHYDREIISERGFLCGAFIDLTQIYLFGAPYPTYCGLDMAAKQMGLYGITNEAGECMSKEAIEERTGVTGANFHEFLNSGDIDKHSSALEYLSNDLALTRGIADIIL